MKVWRLAAYDYLTKPINFVVLEAKLRSVHRTLGLQQNLIEALNRVQVISDGVMEAILTVDDKTRITSANGPTEQLFGWKPSEIVGQSLDVLIHGKDQSEDFIGKYCISGSEQADLRLRVSNIMTALPLVDPHQGERVVRVRQRMYQNLEEYLGKVKIDENRFEQEIIFYLEKMDITEEKVRLEQHCNYFLEELNSQDTAKGRKLSFLSQEMGREINTLGAKAYSSEIQRLVVNMKDELEKIKELIANTI